METKMALMIILRAYCLMKTVGTKVPLKFFPTGRPLLGCDKLMVYSSEFGILVDQMRIPQGCQCGVSVAGTANIPPSQTQTTSSSGAPPPGSSSSPATQSERAPYATPTVL
ncbi:hypothetical protein BV898_07050 [Hypsibius exemplaris]|uniref:Uncharacterized protein n=1 Tax=Hypsibius exemplaris TaxID=2072580 RepID=A0A1W0WUX3_HYPEX|nr:hypothetical protein BV898_07050 [Hypsibius exemplaris]